MEYTFLIKILDSFMEDLQIVGADIVIELGICL
jgi:hypothetical protein